MRPRSEQPIPELIRRDLITGPATPHDLASAIGIHVRNMRVYVQMMHANKEIHISDYERGRQGPPRKVYALGNRPDKKQPKGRMKRDLF